MFFINANGEDLFQVFRTFHEIRANGFSWDLKTRILLKNNFYLPFGSVLINYQLPGQAIKNVNLDLVEGANCSAYDYNIDDRNCNVYLANTIINRKHDQFLNMKLEKAKINLKNSFSIDTDVIKSSTIKVKDDIYVKFINQVRQKETSFHFFYSNFHFLADNVSTYDFVHGWKINDLTVEEIKSKLWFSSLRYLNLNYQAINNLGSFKTNAREIGFSDFETKINFNYQQKPIDTIAPTNLSSRGENYDLKLNRTAVFNRQHEIIDWVSSKNPHFYLDFSAEGTYQISGLLTINGETKRVVVERFFNFNNRSKESQPNYLVTSMQEVEYRNFKNWKKVII